ncbi:MAG: gamma carbonic anhydrase family protein [Xanthobacteraceae bacterium]|nr:gamma carbonic anhydrase family protein [Xanthobacteraceae bacterium]PWB62895.1 MAG: gamma carbonic anhydrase family protein [Bradyrhizobiaceae bacterium]
MPLFSFGEDRPDVAPQCWVAENAFVIGRVRIRAGASIWFGAVLRGDNEWIEIGERTNIQDNCTLHTDPGFAITIGAGCTVGHNAVVHGCTIGRNTLIGMGAIVMNGAKVGDNCVIGAGALIREGMVVPDNSLMVGSPARKIRDLDAAAARFNTMAADVYFNRWQSYAATFKRVP